MKEAYNKLLRRQIRKYLKGVEIGPEMERFMDAVSESYDHMDRDQDLMRRAMETSSDELLAKNRELQAKNSTLDSFVYRVSHDLKTPANNLISMVKMLSDVLEKSEPSPMVRQILDHLDKAGNSMRTRIFDLLEMTRVEHRMQEPPEPLAMDELISDVLKDLDQQITNTDARIDIDFAATPVLLFGKENMVSILANLVGNALKYRQPDRKPEVRVYTATEGEDCFLVIEDNGLGMDLEKYGNRLFSMFARLHDHVEGTGIGLYIVKKIVENANGNIHVASKINVGTKFTLRFPREIAQHAPELHPADR
jgi:signal transduction histidine kinase